MNHMKRRITILSYYVLFVAAVITTLVFGKDTPVYASDEESVDIVFTTDTHSYLSSYSVQKNGETVNVGGMPRMVTYINKMRKEHPDLLLVDAGDYPMGTLYQTLFEKEAFEYRMLSDLNYDAITFGNHDFDYGTEGLALQFEAAKKKCDFYPNFVICNIDFSASDDPTNRILKSMEGMNLCDYVILNKGGVKIGITGVLGKDAYSCAPTCELTYLDPVESVKKTVAKMKEEENPDIIVCLSHSGTTEEGSKEVSEDEILAKEVPDIDFIVSGHTHRVLPEYIQVGDTYIGSTGCYGDLVGYARLKKNDKGRYDLVTYELVPMDESVEEDDEKLKTLKEYDELIDELYLKDYGYKANQVICHNTYDFSSVDDLYFVHDDHNLGQIIADSYKWQIENMDTGNDDPVAVSVAPSGTIRASFPKGDITVAKVYEVFSLGKGLDGTVGYPLVDVYLTGKELYTVCEIDASISPLMTSANLYLGGVQFEFNNDRPLMNKTTAARLETGIGSGEYIEIEEDKLYRVVTDLYSVRMLSAVEKISKGLISLSPKDRNGNPIMDESECIIHDSNNNEVKAWIAIANYLQSLDEDGDNIGEIPALYDGSDDRKVINYSDTLHDKYANTNMFFWIPLIVGIVVLTAVIVVIILIVKKIVRKKQK